MSGHIMVAIDPYDGGTTVCRGYGEWGTFTEDPAGECPTPYKSDSQLLAEAGGRESILRAEVEALRKDAERYRWLRHKDSMPCVVSSNPQADKHFNEYMLCGEQMDKAIDLAMESNQ